MVDGTDVVEVIKETFNQWEEANKTNSIAIFKEAIAGFNFALKNIELQDQYSAAFIYSRMAWLHLDASFAFSKAARSDTKRGLELYRERDECQNKCKVFARKALELYPDAFYAQRVLTLLSFFNADLKGIGGWLSQGSLRQDLAKLVDIHSRVPDLNEFVAQAELLMSLDKFMIDDGFNLHQERKILFGTIAEINIGNLLYKDDEEKEEEMRAAAKKIQRQARVMLESL